MRFVNFDDAKLLKTFHNGCESCTQNQQSVYDNVDVNENDAWGKQGSLMQSIIYNRVLSFIVPRSSFIVKGSPRSIPVQDSQDKYKNIRTFAADNL